MIEFPEEILQAVVESIAMGRILPHKNRQKYQTTALLPLSMVNCQLRRICLPFLFSCVDVRGHPDVEKLIALCVVNKAFAVSIKSIDLSHFLFPLLSQLPPSHFPNLVQINSTCNQLTTPLVTAIKFHPAPIFFFESFTLPPSTSLLDSQLLSPSDLAKVVLDHQTVTDELKLINIGKYLSHGMRVNVLSITLNTFTTPLLNDSFGERKFPALRELSIQVDPGTRPFTLSWLLKLAREHPLLMNIYIQDNRRVRTLDLDFFKREPIIPFIESFVDQVRNEGFIDTISIRSFGIRRMSFHVHQWGSGRFLHLAHASFPRIVKLGFSTDRSVACPFDDLVKSLRRFPSLEEVYFVQPISMFEEYIAMQAPGCPDKLEAAVIQYTSRISQRIPSIKTIFIDDEFEPPKKGRSSWSNYYWGSARKQTFEHYTLVHRCSFRTKCCSASPAVPVSPSCSRSSLCSFWLLFLLVLGLILGLISRHH
ncbi:hypothetical protein BT96DRAFT_927901 [Gymnopus androsaceus JB14]|uniref:Uncharacterized protein n=1 Tax=Gymnopus androsaceus JB14 TaxID=1447944 RepID=A0A6A4GNJ0_9AGAR|nr:hypothetical protein BT96DRAFT_927901 [Gymnopus androsaceus JB14]